MKTVVNKLFVLFIFLAFVFTACTSNGGKQNAEKEADKITVDREFTDFFARNCCGVTGADGVYSVPLPDGRVVWIFGDSFLGTVNPDGSRGKRSPLFIRNCFAVQDGDSLRTLYNINDGWDASLVIPPGAPKGKKFSEDSLWYWPGDGFIENGKIKVFMSGFIQAKPGNWGFKWVSANIATFSLPEIKLESIKHLSYPNKAEVHWGHCVCDQADDYTYIYGAGDKYPYVARAPKGNINKPWEFFTGVNWAKNSELAKPMLNVKGSEQFSVIKLKDKYVLITQLGDFLKSSIFSFTSDLPYTGWSNKKELYKLVPPNNDKNLFVYNPVAHPEFTKNNQLLVSYCVNSFKLEDLFTDASKYRPIFIRIPVEMILEK